MPQALIVFVAALIFSSFDLAGLFSRIVPGLSRDLLLLVWVERYAMRYGQSNAVFQVLTFAAVGVLGKHDDGTTRYHENMYKHNRGSF